MRQLPHLIVALGATLLIGCDDAKDTALGDREKFQGVWKTANMWVGGGAPNVKVEAVRFSIYVFLPLYLTKRPNVNVSDPRPFLQFLQKARVGPS